jgi:hypothetical protein
MKIACDEEHKNVEKENVLKINLSAKVIAWFASLFKKNISRPIAKIQMS